MYPFGAVNLYSKHKNEFWRSGDDEGSAGDDNNGTFGKFGDWKIPVELNCTQRQLAIAVFVGGVKNNK